MRKDGRRDDELRPITFQRHFNETPAGSVLVSYGKTKVLCTACIEDGVPHWMNNSGRVEQQTAFGAGNKSLTVA